MYYVYVLRQGDGDRIYVGFTSNLRNRLIGHQKKEHRGWKLVYYEAYASEKDARDREKKLKHHRASIGHLKARIKWSLIEQAIERAGEASSPSPRECRP